MLFFCFKETLSLKMILQYPYALWQPNITQGYNFGVFLVLYDTLKSLYLDKYLIFKHLKQFLNLCI